MSTPENPGTAQQSVCRFVSLPMSVKEFTIKILPCFPVPRRCLSKEGINSVLTSEQNNVCVWLLFDIIQHFLDLYDTDPKPTVKQ